MGNKKIACIGSGTVEALETFYIKPDYVPKEYSVKTLLSELKEYYGKNRKILLLSSDIHGRSEKELSKEYNLQIKIKDNIICLGNRYSNVIKLGNIDYNMLNKGAVGQCTPGRQ